MTSTGAQLVHTCVILSLLVGFTGASAQSTNGKTPRQLSQNERLAKPVDWSEYSAHLFKDSPVTMTFRLATSWIPGEDHKGMFRYKLNAFPKKPTTVAEAVKDTELDTPEKIESFVKRVNQCEIFLALYDSDGFLLRSVPVSFDRGVNSEGQLQALSANRSTQMDADEYRMFVGSNSTSGSWAVSWNCPESP